MRIEEEARKLERSVNRDIKLYRIVTGILLFFLVFLTIAMFYFFKEVAC
jgi:tetrahydromethanopterin S-methyltransferase subunit G